MDRKSQPFDPVNYDELTDTLALPEKRLWAAVIQRAILDYVSGDRQQRRKAKKFLFSDTPGQSDFRLIVSILFTDAEGIVRRVRERLRNGTLSPKKVAPPE